MGEERSEIRESEEIRVKKSEFRSGFFTQTLLILHSDLAISLAL